MLRRLVGTLLILGLAGCAPIVAQSSMMAATGETGGYERLQIGESISLELLDTPNHEHSSNGEWLEFRTISRPLKVELGLADGALRFPEVGGAGFPISIGIRQGKLWSIELSLRNRLLTLDEAWSQVENVCSALTELGFAAGPSFSAGFSNQLPSEPSSLVEAKRLLEAEPSISELGLYAGEKYNTRVGLSVWNSSRKAHEIGMKTDATSSAQWRVVLQVVGVR